MLLVKTQVVPQMKLVRGIWSLIPELMFHLTKVVTNMSAGLI